MPEQRLRQVLLSISQLAERDLMRMSSRHPHASIHMLRVRMKKIRAILRIIEPSMAHSTMEAIMRSVRALKRAFAMNRDEHVINALLAELSNGEIICRREYVAPMSRDEADERLGKDQQRRLLATAHALTQRLRTMRLCPLSWDEIAKTYARSYAKSRRWFRRCERNPSVARMHHWRALVKDHYFQSLVLLRDRHHLDATRKLGSLLGQIHDLDMLREHYNHDSTDRLSRAIHRRMKSLRIRILRKARRLYVVKPRKIERLVRAAHKIGFKYDTGG